MNEIWRYPFPMKKDLWDNDYVFYSDGRIKHIYDRNQKNIGIEEFVSPSSIYLEERKTMLEKCPEDLRERIKSILEL